MDPRLSRRLLDRGKGQPKARPTGSNIGLVAATSPLTVTIGGSTVPALKNDDYTPTIGDRVYVLRAANEPPVIAFAIG